MPKIAYNVVYHELKRKIEGRLFPPGSCMPSENTLATQYQISRTTARKVLQMLSDKGFIASRAGVGWEVRSSDPDSGDDIRRWTIGVDTITSDWSMYYHKHLLAGMHDAIRDSRSILSVIGDASRPERWLEEKVDALVLMWPRPEHYDQYAALARQGIPVVFINREAPCREISSFAIDYTVEARRAVEYLLLTGHRDIAMIGGGATSMEWRENGYFQAFAARNLEVPKHLVMRDFSVQQQAEVLEKYRPSAAFVVFGMAVVNFILAAERAKLRIPDDLSLICFDDMSDNPMTDFPLTHIRMPLFNMGRDAVNHALRRLKNPEEKPVRVTYDADLCINSSCRYHQS